MDAEDVVVSGEHVHVGGTTGGGVLGDLDLRVVDAGEVAGAGRLVLLGLEREGVRVDARHGATGVMVVRLDLVEVFALLLLETVLAVEDELEGGEGTIGILGVSGTGIDASADREEGRTERGEGNVAVGVGGGGLRLENDISIGGDVGEVPERVLVGGNVGEAPHKLLDGVVVGEADLLGLALGHSVNTSVLNLLNEVLVTLLGESATLLSVKVDIVGPHLEGAGVKEGAEVGREVNINAHLMILQCNEWQKKPRISVKKENEG